MAISCLFPQEDSADGETKTKPKRRLNRFGGKTEEEVAKQGLPDYLKEDLDVVFIGINPSMFAAHTQKYYDGPGNHFWKALFLSGFLGNTPWGPGDEKKLLDLGIGFTNVVARTTRVSCGKHLFKTKFPCPRLSLL